MSRRPRLSAEPLDARLCPALFGNPWLDPNLTVSFVPDGTAVNGTTSRLGTAFANIPAGVRTAELLRAFQTWADVANVNFGLVADGGQPVGTAGAARQDPRFGDVRISAEPLATDNVALALPYDVTAGTRAGDLMLNSTEPFTTGGGAGYDLYSVALHEIGHVLGLPDSTDPNSVMYDVADRVRTGLGDVDIAAVQQLYGPRQADGFEGAAGNATLATAAEVQPGSGGSRRITFRGDVTTAGDVDVYRFKADHLNGGAYLVNLTAAGVSLIKPTVDVLDAHGNVIATGTAAGVGAGDVSLRLAGLKEGDTYYLRVRSADPSFAVGGYEAELRPEVVDDGGGLNDDESGANDGPDSATSLSRLPALAGSRANYAVASSLGSAADVDFFDVRAPQSGKTSAGPLTVSVVATDASGLDPIVQVFDRNRQPVAATVLVRDGGEYTVQVADAEENRDYFVAVRHAGGNTAVGNYSLGMDFGGPLVPLQAFAGGSLASTAPASTTPFTVPQGQVLHLILVLDPTATPAAARMSVFDAAGHAVDSRLAATGSSASMNVTLSAGTYQLLVGGGATDGGPMPTIKYAVTGMTLSGPIGPRAVQVDPVTGAPVVPPPPLPVVPPVVTSPPQPVTPVPPTTTSPPASPPPATAPPATTPVTPAEPNILLLPPTDQPTSPILRLRPVSPPPAKTFSVGMAAATGSTVNSYNADGSLAFSVVPFAGYTGTLRTAEADFNGDGTADLLVGTGPGSASRVVLLDGKTQAVLDSLSPFEPGFTGGLFVAAGDLTGDGLADVVLTPDQGGGPRVRVFAGGTFAPVADFFGIDDPNFRGGARVAVGDVNADGVADLVVSAGFAGGPRLAGFSGAELAKGNTVKVFNDFFAFEDTLRNGTYVTVGDVDGDGYAEVIVGGGPGGGPRVVAFGGKQLVNGQDVPVANFFGGDPADRDGVRVAAKDLDGDGRADLVVGVGRRVTGYDGVNVPATGTPPAAFDFEVSADLTEGVFVG